MCVNIFANIGFRSRVYATTILPNLSFKSEIDVAKQKIAIISDATTISKPSCRGYPLPTEPSEQTVLLSHDHSYQALVFHATLLTSI